jgi:uncharacterized membrane protein YfcA
MEISAAIVAAGVGVGFVYGLFGVGSAFATPVLSLLGVHGLAAVVGPLPALLPGSAASAWSYSRQGDVDWRLARRASTGALPMAISGAMLSRWVGGPLLLVLSGTVLVAVGLRVLLPGAPVSAATATRRREARWFVIGAAALIGFAAGLLANGGGFLLVPLFLLALGLDMHEATGTSMVVAAVLTVPTLVTHALIGDIEWSVALSFAIGLVPGALAATRTAPYVPTARLRTALGALLIGFAVWYVCRQGLALFS